ncbi:ArnT family glycosyltransferase [Archangium sp.]|uniref:ArnT family glycosyltransferase n=1 Tax=Archangium sp. TaxID=1872627 RepID=UPI00389A9301
MSSPAPSRQPGPLAWAALVFLGLTSATWWPHSDLGDSQLYQVVSRHMVEDGAWLSLRYLPDVHPRFFEHLPFGFWPFALVIRLFGEPALRPLCALFSLGTLLLTSAVARRAAGTWAGATAMLVLAFPDGFFIRGGHPFLEPLLLLLSTASALPVLLGVPRARDWFVCGVLAAGACAVKGPFGLLPFAGATVARALVERSWKVFVIGSLVGLAATVPTVLFLVTHADWWEGYVRHQVLASASGERTDGQLSWYLPWRTVVSRFWPGLPLLATGGVLALGRPARAFRSLLPEGTRDEAGVRRSARVLLLASLFVLTALCIPGRKVWNHSLVVFPLLAMLVGVGVGPWLEARLASPGRARKARLVLAGLALVVLGASAAGAGRLLFPPPCPASGALAAQLADVPPGASVLVVSPRAEWTTVAAFAVERRWSPWRLTGLGAGLAPGGPSEARVAFVAEGAPVNDSAWHEVGRDGRWRLLRRP